nr:MAG TPA: hypothetical protein [Caudoviricetes sp.]
MRLPCTPIINRLLTIVNRKIVNYRYLSLINNFK